jgi:hypothetical protein
MSNPWKLATIGIALTGMTAVSTGVTTAYLMRPTTSADTLTAPASNTGVALTPATAAPARRPARVARPASTPAAVTPAVATPPAVATQPAVPTQPAVATQPAVVTPVSASIPADCSTGGDRAMRIAKPGVIGTLAGAGLGAIGGAIADGGAGAGKGALIGGLAGAAVGGGYGAYKTKQECGTIFGDAAPGFAGAPTVANVPTVAPQAALRSPDADGITVYHAR